MELTFTFCDRCNSRQQVSNGRGFAEWSFQDCEDRLDWIKTSEGHVCSECRDEDDK